MVLSSSSRSIRSSCPLLLQVSSNNCSKRPVFSSGSSTVVMLRHRLIMLLLQLQLTGLLLLPMCHQTVPALARLHYQQQQQQRQLQQQQMVATGAAAPLLS